MEFPSLTGLQPRATTGKRGSTTIDSKLQHATLCDATASISASPLSALQAAWAVILAAYLDEQSNATFVTAIPAPPDNGVVQHDYHFVPTQACLNSPKNLVSPTNGSILKQLTQYNSLAVYPSVNFCADDAQPSRKGTLVAFYSKERSDDDKAPDNKLDAAGEFAVTILAWPCTTGFLKLQATYTDRVLDDSCALVVLAQLDDILAYILTDFTKPIQASSTAIRTSHLSISNPNLVSRDTFSETAFLHTQFELTAQKNSSRVALEFRHDIRSDHSTIWTYSELSARADAFAKYLVHSFGDLSKKVIPICMEKCPELYVAILGILKSGGAWCPVDVSFPARRRHNLIARTGSQILVVASPTLRDTSEGIPQGIAIIDITKLDNAESGRVKLSDVHMGSLAYLIWTSGTTGDPKGVPITHEAAATSMKALQTWIPVDVTGGTVRCLQFSHFTFDVFVQDLFYTWGVGGTIICPQGKLCLAHSQNSLTERTRPTLI